MKLGELIDIKHGFAFKGDYISTTPNSNVLLTPGNFKIGGGFQFGKGKYYTGAVPEDYVLQADDLIVTMTDLSKFGDTLGYSAKVPINDKYRFLHNQRIGLVRLISHDADKEFIHWLMRTYKYQKYIVNRASGSSVKHTSPNIIKSYTFKKPTLPEQRAIAATLSCLDDKIELNDNINANLEAQAQAIFKSWFVDFEPFRDGEFVDSELGPIPKGWRVSKFTDLVNVLGGGTPKTDTSAYWNGEIPFFTPKDVTGVYTMTTEKYITVDGLQNCNSHLYPANTTFITARGTVGKIALAGIEMAMNQSCYALQSKTDCQQFFVYGMAHQVVKSLQHKSSGAVFNAIVTRDFSSELIIIPSDDIINDFQCLVSPLYNSILHRTKQNHSLATLRDTLLPKLMSGEIEVPVAESTI